MHIEQLAESMALTPVHQGGQQGGAAAAGGLEEQSAAAAAAAAAARLRYAFAVRFPLNLALKKELAEQYVSMGFVGKSKIYSIDCVQTATRWFKVGMYFS